MRVQDEGGSYLQLTPARINCGDIISRLHRLVRLIHKTAFLDLEGPRLSSHLGLPHNFQHLGLGGGLVLFKIPVQRASSCGFPLEHPCNAHGREGANHDTALRRAVALAVHLLGNGAQR